MNAKTIRLAEIEGFSDPMDMLSHFSIDSVVTGICMTPGCDYTTEVEPDQEKGWCEKCQKGTVSSPLIIEGLI